MSFLKPNESEPLALRSRDAARALGISERFLWALTKTGKVPCVRLGDGKRVTVLYPVEALKQWLKDNEEAGEGQ